MTTPGIFPVDVSGWFYRKTFNHRPITVWSEGEKVEGRESWESWHVRVTGNVSANIYHFMLPDEILAFGHGFQWGKLKVFIDGKETYVTGGLSRSESTRRGLQEVNTQIIQPIIKLVDMNGNWGEHRIGLLHLVNGFVQSANPGEFPHIDKKSGWAFAMFEGCDNSRSPYKQANDGARMILDNVRMSQ